ncbi:CPBP family intramembrane glutamic endopeptidase [Oceaniglobus roseus]|uniref:CPBP family intramembrane glutamic endopeptidase n=1 Tax=Oceaniglobus roseus TaxID=1737570 RepID=UPI000C7ECB5A|nr:type II CAAX endopeptidase family protein [Kandeliimicrobium roseum]
MYRQAFEDFVAPARARPQLWRLVLGVLLTAACAMLWVVVLLGAVWLGGEGGRAMDLAAELAEPVTPGVTLILLATFLGMALGPMLAARLLHRRRAGTLFGPGDLLCRDFAVAAATVLAIYGTSTAVWLWLYTPVHNLSPVHWLILLPFALVGVAIQTGAEELVFRGYLQQQLAARFRSPLVWLVLPALAFGMVHYDPASNGANAWLVVASAALFGLVAADLTAQSGSLGAAWGFHFANNLIALVVLATKGTITGLALYTTPYEVSDEGALTELVLVDLAILLLAWGLVRRFVRR